MQVGEAEGVLVAVVQEVVGLAAPAELQVGRTHQHSITVLVAVVLLDPELLVAAVLTVL
jgi:hypothetical protein